MKKLSLMVLSIVVLVGLCFSVRAMDDDLEGDFITGFIQEISATSIRITGNDTDQGKVGSFVITEQTEFENINSWSDLGINDEVFIDYKVMNYENIATNIFKIGTEDESDEGGYEIDESDEGGYEIDDSDEGGYELDESYNDIEEDAFDFGEYTDETQEE